MNFFSHRWILGTRNLFLACSSLPCELNYRQIILQLRVCLHVMCMYNSIPDSIFTPLNNWFQKKYPYNMKQITVNQCIIYHIIYTIYLQT
jgi:hypothetical protein